MPVSKYRSVADMPDAPRRDPTDPEHWRVVRALWDLAARTLPPLGAPGVYKNRSVDELGERVARWERERAAAMQRDPARS